MSVAFSRQLNDVETAIVLGVLKNQTYEQIAEESGYSISYLTRDIGPKLWKALSQALGERISKTSFQTILEQQWQQMPQTPTGSENKIPEVSLPPPESSILYPFPKTQTTNTPLSSRCDWGEATDVSLFYGRVQELKTLKEWLLQQRCRFTIFLGMGGIGKTSLSVKLAQEVQDEFDCVIWRSLRNAPLLNPLLEDVISFISQQQDTQTDLDRLLYWLRKTRCLLVLDNVETILQPGDAAGYYLPDYEDYGELFRAIGETAHQSSVILTSREKPAEIAALEGMESAVRSLRLGGSPEAAQALIDSKGLMGTAEQQQQLCQLYGYNPLALKMVATTIQDLFDGQIAAFLDQEATVFSGINRLLSEQVERCSASEKTIMYWLAINRDWTSIAELAADIVPIISRAELLETLESLSWRSLIEKRAGRYTQQPVVMEYVTNQIIERVCAEIAHELKQSSDSPRVSGCRSLPLLHSHAILKANGKDYVREAQISQLLKPILNNLLTIFGNPTNVEHRLAEVLSWLRQEASREMNYAGGNILNLLCQLHIDLTGYDFSQLTFWQADLRGIKLNHVNFAGADLQKAAFTETLAIPLAVTFSPDGQLLATADVGSEIRLWQVADGKSLLTCKGHSSWVWSIAFSPDSSILASGSNDKTIRLWDVQTGQCFQIWQGHSSQIWAVAFSPDGQLLASGSEDQTIKLWDVNTGNCLDTLAEHNNWVRSVAFSPDGRTIASGSDDYTVKLWDVSSGICFKTLRAHSQAVWSVAFHPTGKQLISSSSDQTIKLWDVNTGDCLNTLEGHNNWVRSVAFSPNGRTIASGSEDKTIKLWNAATGQCVQTLRGHTNWVRSVAFSPDSQSLASGSGDHTVKFWDLDVGRCRKTLQGYTNRVWAVAFNPVHSLLASAYDDYTIRLWDLNTFQSRSLLQGHSNAVCAIAFSPNGEILASSSSDQTIKLWNVQTGSCFQTLRGHSSRVWSVAFSPDGQLLASGGDDQTIKLWELSTGRCRKTLRGHSNWVCSVAFHPDSAQTLISGSYDQTVKCWNAMTGECLQTLTGHENWIWSVAISPDGQTIASGSGDHTIKLWDAATGTCRQTLQGHSSRVWSVAFNPEGTHLLSGSSDQTVKYWDVQTGECLQTWRGHQNLVWSIAFSPSGQEFASGSQDETVKLWQLTASEPVQTLKADRPYEGMNIARVTGLTESQRLSLKQLGAVEI
ncbi:MAG: NB-ARC domain-containing protein [Elainellaceae cyanobacterium]